MTAILGMTVRPAPAATAQAWVLDGGGGVHGQLTPGAMGNFTGNGLGLDLYLCARPETSGLGFRIAGAMTKYATTETNTEGEVWFFGIYDVSGTGKTSHWVTRVSAGPQWSIRAADQRWDLYVLAGMATIEPQLGGFWIGVENRVPEKNRVFIATLGAALDLPLGFADASGLEIGVEVQTGGRGTFFGDPPIEQDGGGGYRMTEDRAGWTGVTIRIAYTRSVP